MTNKILPNDTSAAAQIQQLRVKAKDSVAKVENLHRIRGLSLGFLIMALLTAVVFWAAKTPLDEIAMAQGKVIPLGDNRVVQHLEGGILVQVLVKEGDSVEQDQPLFHLELGTGSMDIARLETQLAGLEISRLRLTAEADLAETFRLPERFHQNNSDLARAEENLFASNYRTRQSALGVLTKQLEQRRLSAQEIELSISTNQDLLDKQRELVAILENQYDIGVASRVDLLQANLRLEEIEGVIPQLRKSLDRVWREIEEISLTRDQSNENFRSIALRELQEKEENIATIRKSIDRADNQASRSIVKSPIAGIVKSVTYTTIGNVVRSGEILAEIVPTQNNLIIEASLMPVDRGFVRVGQPAKIKLETFDYSRYGGLEGEVTLVGASSVTTERGLSYFEIQVMPEKTYLGEQPGDLEITPGMIATVDILTGQRTVLSFLLRPIFKLREEAFRER